MSEPPPEQFLKELSVENQITWSDYIAPASFKVELQSLPRRFDPGFRAALNQAREKRQGGPQGLVRTTGIPMALFTGPPGTGKTHAMRILAATAELKPYVFDAVGLQELSYEPEKLFVQILARISQFQKAVILIDECETVFGNREALAGYGSVYAQKQMKLLTSFIRWAEGLETQNDWEERRVMLILATNMPAALDMAVRSRVRVTMDFPLPNAEQCTEWWQRNACHLVPSSRVQSQNLNGVPPHPHHKKLGAMSVGLSFRGLNSVAEKIDMKDASKSPDPSQRPSEPTLKEMLAEIELTKRVEQKELSERMKALYKNVAGTLFSVTQTWWLMQSMYGIVRPYRARL